MRLLLEVARAIRAVESVNDCQLAGYLTITESETLMVSTRVGDPCMEDHCLLSHQATAYARFLAQLSYAWSSLEVRNCTIKRVYNMRGGAVKVGLENFIVSFASSLVRLPTPDDRELRDEVIAVAIADQLWVGAYERLIAPAFSAREEKGCLNPHVAPLLHAMRGAAK